jgi:hypothetical protein
MAPDRAGADAAALGREREGRAFSPEDGNVSGVKTIGTAPRRARGRRQTRGGRGTCASWMIGLLGLVAVGPAQAVDVAGVLPTSIGLPEVNAVLRPSAGAAPYTGMDSFGDPLANLRLIYDTGASGVILFEGPAQALGIPIPQFMGSDVVFTDVGVGGSTTFDVSGLVHLSLGNFVQDPPNPYTMDGDYPRQSPDLRLQLGPPGSAALFLSDFTQLGIAGVPAMTGRVSVIAPKLAEVSFFELTVADTIHTYVYEPGVPPESGPGIPPVDLHVELTLESFDRFTETTPAGASPPSLSENPFIGPDPLAALEGQSPLPTTPPGITVSLGPSQVTGTFLLDTGSQITSISSAMALTLGIRYWAPGDPGYDPGVAPMLVLDADGSLVADQFSVTLGGIAGTTTIAGFNADALLVRTVEGDPLDDADPNHLNFVPAPVFVQDIELMDPVTMDTFTFDGILGTNYLFGSGDLSALAGFEVPFRPGPFEWLVLDLDASPATLGVSFPVSAVPLSRAFGLAVAVLLAAVGVRIAAQGRSGRRCISSKSTPRL